MTINVQGQALIDFSVSVEVPDNWAGTEEELEKLAHQKIGGLSGLLCKINTLDDDTATFELADETITNGIIWTVVEGEA